MATETEQGLIQSDDDFRASVSRLYEEAEALFWTKHAHYGTANIAAGGVAGVLGRIHDKVARIEVLTEAGDVFRAEDSMLDLANYAIILLALARGTWPMAGNVRRVKQRGATLQALRGGFIYPPQKPGDVGFDLGSVEAVIVPAGGSAFIRTGTRIKCPDGIWAKVVGRSSLFRNFGLIAPESVIDEGYTGELGIPVFNPRSEPVKVPEGTRVGQVILHRAIVPELYEVEFLPETARGATGFGSTGR